MDPIRVEVRRGEVVEAVHRVHAVAVSGADGRIVAHAGEPDLVSFLRSCAKPVQARQLLLAAPDVPDDLLAVACSSHGASPAQLDAVRRLLARAGATPDDLALGPQAERGPDRLRHSCSGKHAGMLVACAAHRWPRAGYHRPDHPLQQAILADVAAAAGLAPAAIPVAVDGCTVPCFAMTLARAALVATRSEPRIAGAMRAHPDLIGPEDSPDVQLMQRLPGWVAKKGAEGLLTLCSPDRVGVALKVEDGSPRGLRPAVAAFLGRLGVALPDWQREERRDSRDEHVGWISIPG